MVVLMDNQCIHVHDTWYVILGFTWTSDCEGHRFTKQKKAHQEIGEEVGIEPVINETQTMVSVQSPLLLILTSRV